VRSTRAQTLQKHPVQNGQHFAAIARSKRFTPFIKINCNTVYFISPALCYRIDTLRCGALYTVAGMVSDISITARAFVSSTGYRGPGRRSAAGSVGCFKITAADKAERFNQIEPSRLQRETFLSVHGRTYSRLDRTGDRKLDSLADYLNPKTLHELIAD